ncbi:putative Bromodomain [Blattamonas nauphoetae]|uniref:Bromodomain n=1 Tax=Blattamonas nauphoetae TaxID=2049346 RepID=A0ABQ9YHW0_9EUKA|nr:putative Bromodomain [Blattamonas nauphoetae]
MESESDLSSDPFEKVTNDQDVENTYSNQETNFQPNKQLDNQESEDDSKEEDADFVLRPAHSARHQHSTPKSAPSKLFSLLKLPEHIAIRFKFLRRLLTDLIRHKYSSPFLEPVDTVQLNIPEYTQIIQHPMDFGTIRRKYDAADYGYSVENMIHDLYLVFDNCFHFNPPKNAVSEMGDTLHKITCKRMRTSLLFTMDQVAMMEDTQPYKYYPDPSSYHPDEDIPPPMVDIHGILLHPAESNRHNPDLNDLLERFDGDTTPLTREEINTVFEQIRSLPAHFFPQIVQFIQTTSPQSCIDVGDGIYEFDFLDFDVCFQRHFSKYIQSCVNVVGTTS